MAHQSLETNRRPVVIARSLCFFFFLIACRAAPAVQPISTPADTRVDLADPSRNWLRFVSPRQGVSLPLPFGKTWKIDDHKNAFLIASHAPTASTITLQTWNDDDLQSRSRCETTARLTRVFPDSELDTVEDDHVTEPGSFDTRLWIAIETPQKNAPRKVLVGHVIAVGGFVRRCLFFHFRTEVPLENEEALSARLALVRTRIFGDLKLGNIEWVAREKSSLHDLKDK